MAAKENSSENKALETSFKEGDIVICTVTGIEHTVVFVKTDSGIRGSIVMSEIAAGRIRNLREYVVMNKKLVCKILKVLPDHLELSLRRVMGKEREEAVAKDKKEKALYSLLKGTIKNSESVLDEIKSKKDLAEFYEDLKANPSLISEFLNKEETNKFIELLKEKEETEKKSKKTIILRTLSENGLEDIKSILKDKENQQLSVKYLGSAQYCIEAVAKNFKEANIILDEVIEKIMIEAKSKKIQFDLKEEK